MAIAIDGGSSSATITSNAVTSNLTTTNSNCVIIVYAYNETNTGGGTVSSPAGLTWNLRKSQTWNAGASIAEMFYAVSASPLSADAIKVQYAATASARIIVFGISGADTSTIFDANASLPAAGTATAATTVTLSSLSTSNANDMLLVGARCGSPGNLTSRPSGFTQVVSSGVVTDSAYKIVSSTQSSISTTYTWTFPCNSVAFFDAVMQSSSGFIKCLGIGGGAVGEMGALVA